MSSIVEGSDVAQAGLAPQEPVAWVDGRDVSAATRDEFCGLHAAAQPGDEHVISGDGGRPIRSPRSRTSTTR